LIYTTFGKTGLRVSRLGFGAMRLPMAGQGRSARVDDDKAIQIMHHAFRAGVNFVDSAVFYCNSDSQRAVGEALKAWPDRIIISTKNSYKDRDERLWWKNLEDSLRLLGVQCIDIYNIHGLSWKVWCELGEPLLSKWLLKARDQGLIRHIGASTHETPDGFDKLIDTGFFESFIVQYNMLDRQLEAGIARARARGIGIAVMGPLGGGRLADPTEAFASVVPAIRRTPELALRFVLANPGVSVAMSGMETRQIIDENAAIAGSEAPLSAEELRTIDQHLVRLKNMAELYCTGCGYCMPCPQEVRIPRIFRIYNLARVYGLWQRARGDYAEIVGDQWDPGARDAGSCIQCGQCEKKCPQKLAIIEQLKQAHKALTEDS